MNKDFDRQEFFNVSYRHLKKQGFERSTDGTLCRYRHPIEPGYMCGIGPHIPDNLYSEEMEGNRVDQHVVWRVLRIVHDYINEHKSFVIALQSVHDDGLTPDDMEKGLEEFAEDWKLEIPA